MPDTTTRPVPISKAETTRFINEIVASAGSLSDDDMQNAYTEFTEMIISASAIGMWRRGEIKFGCSGGTLTMELANQKATA